jgi:hypothetical protein
VSILFNAGDGPDVVDVLSPLGGVIVLLLWAFIPAVIGASFTMNRDIT